MPGMAITPKAARRPVPPPAMAPSVAPVPAPFSLLSQGAIIAIAADKADLGGGKAGPLERGYGILGLAVVVEKMGYRSCHGLAPYLATTLPR